MNRKVAGYAIYALGVLSYSFNQWLMLTLLTRYLSIETGGKYAYYFAVFTPLFIFFSFGIRNSIATDTQQEFTENDYIAVQLVGFLSFCMVAFVFLSFKGYEAIGWLVFLIKAFDLLSELPYGHWVRSNAAYRYGTSRLFKSLLFISTLLLLYRYFGFHLYVFFVYPLAILCIYLGYDTQDSVYKKIRTVHYNEVSKLIKKSMPLAIGSLIVSLSSVVPRVLLEVFTGYEMVGIYSIAIYVYSLAAIPLVVIMQLILPRIKDVGFEHYLADIKKYLLFYIALVSLGVYLGLNTMMRLVYRTDYIFGGIEIILLIFYGFFQLYLVYFNTIIIGKRKFLDFSKIGLMVLVFNIAISCLLISQYGLVGAFLSTMLVPLISILLINIRLGSYNTGTEDDQYPKA